MSADNQRPPLLAIVDSPDFDLHRSPVHHPERPERLRAARAAIRPFHDALQQVIPRPATIDELARVHSLSYLEDLQTHAGRAGQLDADTYVATDSVAAAQLAAGAGVALVESILTGGPRRGIALLRPPGHHARPDQAMGFCLLNNVAVAAAHAHSLGLGRVAVIDWDVHHGNGTEEMFFARPDVLYASLHQWPLYPGTGSADQVGERDGRGYNVNVPLSAGAGPGVYARAFEEIILPILTEYAPELVLVSAGFDAHRDDPLASMQLDAAAYGWMTSALCQLADRTSQGRIALFLEGGYNLSALETSLGACTAVMLDQADAPVELTGRSSVEGHGAAASVVSPSFAGEIDRARRELLPYWPTCR